MKYQCIKNSSLALYNINRVVWNCRYLFTSNYKKRKITLEEFASTQKVIENTWRNEVCNSISDTVYTNDERCKKKYILSMFPYPSGNLHLGHVRVYTIADAMARYYHLNGYRVIHPMGWDSFGLPAENAAIDRNENPADWTEKNISKMKDQIKSLGCCFQWSREFATCDPNYYKWTQKIFLLLYKAGLAYRQEAVVNWDPIDQTVLANEQVSSEGLSWRSGAKVDKKLLLQWFIKTTVYSERLYNDLSLLPSDNWKSVGNIQRDWIGRCNGYVIEMKIREPHVNIPDKMKNILPVWMKNPEHLNKIKFIALSTDHFLNQEKYNLINNGDITLLDISAIHPISRQSIPIIVSNNFDYAEGCQTYVGIPDLHENDGKICLKVGFQNNTPNSEMTLEDVTSKLKKIKAGGYLNSSHLKDWLVSRQRYWGTPIPIIHCQKCGTVPVPEEDLPVKLPSVKGSIEKGLSVLKKTPDWFNCKCPKCGGGATRETDTLDTFMDSSWYYLRYLDAHNEENIVSKVHAHSYMPVDLYIGGNEHATLHLYYARFINKFLRNDGHISHTEPFDNLLTLAFVKSKSYQVKTTGKYIPHSEVDFSGKTPVEKISGEYLRIKYEKMSKSKFNGIAPHSVMSEYGVDATRLTFISNTDTNLEMNWDPKAMIQSVDFLEKLMFYVESLVKSRTEGLPRTPKKTTEEVESLSRELFNHRNNFILETSQLLEDREFVLGFLQLKKFLNGIIMSGQIMLLDDQYERCLRALLVMLCPFCPFTSAELWHQLNSISKLPEVVTSETIFQQSWPCVDPGFMRPLDCLINYKKMFSINLPVSELRSLGEVEAVSMVNQRMIEEELVLESPLSPMEQETIFHSSINKNYVHFITLPKDQIRRHIKCMFNNENFCTVEVSQPAFESLTERSASNLVYKNKSFREYRKDKEDTKLVVSKFTYIPDGDSKLKFLVKKTKKNKVI